MKFKVFLKKTLKMCVLIKLRCEKINTLRHQTFMSCLVFWFCTGVIFCYTFFPLLTSKLTRLGFLLSFGSHSCCFKWDLESEFSLSFDVFYFHKLACNPIKRVTFMSCLVFWFRTHGVIFFYTFFPMLTSKLRRLGFLLSFGYYSCCFK